MGTQGDDVKHQVVNDVRFLGRDLQIKVSKPCGDVTVTCRCRNPSSGHNFEIEFLEYTKFCLGQI